MAAESRPRPHLPRRGILIGCAAAASLVLAYALAGFLLAPWLAERELPRFAEEKLQHRARVGELRFNPFTLTLRAKDFALEDGGGHPVLGFGEASVDLEWRSILRRAWVLSEVRLASPRARIEIARDGRLNLAALSPGAGAGRAEAPRFAIGRLSLEDGTVEFADEREGYRNRLERISLELSSLSNLEAEKGPYALVGQTPGGAKLGWKGELALAPLAATGTLAVEGAALAELDPYLDAYGSARILAGTADLELPYRFTLEKGEPQLILAGAKIGVRGLEIAARGTEVPVARIPRLALEGVDFDWRARRAGARALRLADAALSAKRDAGGVLDLARMFSSPGDPAPKAAEAPAAWRAEIGAVEISNASLNYTDETSKSPLAVNARGIRATLKARAQTGPHGASASVGAGELGIAEVIAGGLGRNEPAARLAQVQFHGVRFESGAKSLDVEAVRAGKLEVNAAMEDGRLTLLDLVPGPDAEKSEKSLSARVKSAELADGTVSYADRANGLALGLDRLTARLSEFSSNAAKPIPFTLAASVRGGGRLGARGTLTPAAGTLEARIEAAGVALSPLQTLVARYANAKLSSGEVSLAGALSAGGRSAKLAYTGSASLANVAFDDGAGAQLVAWKSLATDSLHWSLAPNRVDIEELRWSAPSGRLAIAADGSNNIGRVFAREGAAPAERKSEGKSAEDDVLPVSIRRVRVEQGALEFADDSLRPGFAAKMQELAGTFNGVSSDRGTRSQFTLEGRIGEFGYAHLSGSLNPFAPRERTGFRVQMRNLDLSAVSPYSMKFAGYRIAAGRLSADLNYRVRGNLLEGDNHLTLDQFTLGERVESPNAFNLPLELAIALLKDADGRIDVAVPVAGNLDDPRFSYGALIWKAIGNLFANVVAAPFRALARLFGGATEEIGIIAFEPGASRLLPPEREKIGRVAAALAKKPELQLVIPARYDAEADARALRRAALGREIAGRAGFASAEDGSPGPINVEDRQTRAALRALFAERLSQKELDKLKAEAEEKERAAGEGKKLTVIERVRNLAQGDPQVADAGPFYFTLVRRLRDTQALAPDALTELAGKRAAAIMDALRAAGADPARLSQAQAAPVADAEAKQVTVQLSLAAAKR